MSAICIPYRPGQPDRDTNFRYLHDRWVSAGFNVFIGDNPEARFSCAGARNNAAEQAGDWATALICDGDILLDLDAVRAALSLARRSKGYVAPYDHLHILNAKMTVSVRAGYRPGPDDAEKTYVQCWPTAFAIHRSLWDRLGGMDAETWQGCGCEDVNFVNRASELVELQRVEGDAFHLFHEPRGAMIT